MINSLINSVFQVLSFVSFSKAFIKIFKINLVRHGDKSRVNNLNKEITLLGSCEAIITFKKFSKFNNFLVIVGFITVLLPIKSSFIIDKCFSQHISVYLFLS